ncbi:MAG: hypothetical protein EOP47_26375 [Sphingobacteriaceae bacterium]|nr:MAG: hypothetical protein EOP47_26375 [Sphingobacteriaceae bacterium]
MKVFLFIIAVTGWFGLIIQLWLNLNNGNLPLDETLIRYFSYFTILTNIMVAVAASVILLVPESKSGRFTTKQATQTAIAVYIVIVGIIYNVLLRPIWNPEGLQRVVDEVLHVIVPVLWLLYWLLLPKNQLQWKNCWPWLLYPLLYSIAIFIRGAFSGFYPYFFIDAAALGLPKALLNAVFVAVAFLLISLLFIGISKLANKKAG